MRKILRNEEGEFDPSIIMSVVVSLIILAVGVFAFFVTVNSINGWLKQNNSEINKAVSNVTTGSNEIFNIIGIVLIIGAIVAMVGLVYSYIRAPVYHEDEEEPEELEEIVVDESDSLADFFEKEKARQNKEYKKAINLKEKPKKKKDGWQI